MNASWPQTKTIWSICVKVKAEKYMGRATDSMFWKSLADEGKLTRDSASIIISAFIDRKSGVFATEVRAYDPAFSIDTKKFMAARRWTPKKTFPKKEEDPKPEAYEFKIGDMVRCIDEDEPIIGRVGMVMVIPVNKLSDDVGIKIDGFDGGHDLGGVLGRDDNHKGWWVASSKLELVDIRNPAVLVEPDPEEDEFTKKLRELEEAHKRSKEAATKKKKLENFRPESIEYVKPAIFDDVCAMIKGGVQVCLVGPSGCGKSLLINEVAKVLGRSLYMESFAGGKRYSQVFGSTHLIDGKSEWAPAKFIQELQVENNIVFMDEVMSADPDVLIGANPILDRKTRCFHSPIGVINIAPTCTICAASNVTGREYSMNYKGTQQQDASVLNRFVHVHMGYDDTVEKTILKKSPLESKDQSFLTSKLAALRRAVSTHNISYDPSTRKLVQAIELYALGLDIEKAFTYAFLTPLSEVERTKVTT